MANIHGPSEAFLYIDGYDLRPKEFSIKQVSKMSDITSIGDDTKKTAPVGVVETTITQGATVWDTSTNAVHDALSTSLPANPTATVRVICAGAGGDTIGQSFIGAEGAYTHAYSPIIEADELTLAGAEHTWTGAADKGVILQNLAEQTADWTTESASVDYVDDTSQPVIPITSNSQANPTVVTTPIDHNLTTGDLVKITGVSDSDIDINFATSGVLVATVTSTTTFTVPINCTTSAGTGGVFVRADSSNGGVGYMHVSELTTFTNLVVTLQDSADDSAWASIHASGVFTDNVSDPFSERIVVDAGTQIDQFLSIDGNVTGSGTVSAWVGFKRTL